MTSLLKIIEKCRLGPFFELEESFRRAFVVELERRRWLCPLLEREMRREA